MKSSKQSSIKTFTLLMWSILFSTLTLSAQDSLTLNTCLLKAKDFTPLSSQQTMIQDKSALAEQNIQTSWYPSFGLNAKVSWQSDVTKIELDVPMPGFEIPSPSHDQYRVTLDASQLIWDGNAIKKQKLLEESNLQSELASLESNLYQLNFTVSHSYFSLLLLQENQKILENAGEALDKRIASAKTAVENGILLSFELDRLKAERLKLNRQLIEVQQQQQAIQETLSLLTGLSINKNTQLAIPDWIIPTTDTMYRPELAAFTARNLQLRASSSLLETKRQPIVAAFGQAGYGNPGLNFLNDEFDDWYIIGINLKWKIFDWNYVAREKQQIAIQQDIIEKNNDAFILQLNIELRRELNNIAMYQKLIDEDKNIVEFRTRITAALEIQMENGVATSAEYIEELSNETAARLEQKTHQLRLHQAITNCNLISGINNK